MPRPRKKRTVRNLPKARGFRPIGIPAHLIKNSKLSIDEYEAIRLVDYVGLNHKRASERMHISRPTLTRLLKSARGKMAIMLIEGRKLFLSGGDYSLRYSLLYCQKCQQYHRVSVQKEQNLTCPDCSCHDVQIVGKRFRRRGGERHRGG